MLYGSAALVREQLVFFFSSSRKHITNDFNNPITDKNKHAEKTKTRKNNLNHPREERTKRRPKNRKSQPNSPRRRRSQVAVKPSTRVMGCCLSTTSSHTGSSIHVLGTGVSPAPRSTAIGDEQRSLRLENLRHLDAVVAAATEVTFLLLTH